MKTLITLFFVSVCLLVPASLYAQQAQTGDVDFAAKLSYISFYNVGNSGPYLGIEAYMPVTTELYIGGEFGYGGDEDTVEFIPIELNIKYRLQPATPGLDIDVGAGFSVIHVDYDHGLRRRNDWLLGAQIFMNNNYQLQDNIFVGTNLKYQITQDFRSEDYDFNNWRIGAHVGFTF